ncbi:hypothetical protein J6TS7_56940 [Paenibacillus dendritiformis]|nr:hypothetical protein J6TS7_56940 [Paenibacillus dendritiformis]
MMDRPARMKRRDERASAYTRHRNGMQPWRVGSVGGCGNKSWDGMAYRQRERVWADARDDVRHIDDHAQRP